ncbi:hypothetical protein [Aerosakkonema funiforme]|uniref:hypothetical protein n=1 Tax=Aerosakkonema funiforme TaxID=1246630 RepID=UPI0035BA80B8
MALNYTVFDEAYYLQNNPDVNSAVNTPGGFFSGIEHFDRFGRFEGRVNVSPYYNENAYLQKYPDVAAAVASGAYSSGLQHFVEVGYDEGRASPLGTGETGLLNSEDVYLRKYPDVAAAVANRVFRSGYDHFLQVGRKEGRSPSYFSEPDYLLFNPDVADAVARGEFASGFDHFVRFGQYEDRFPQFSGTRGNDIVQGFGKATRFFYGVDYQNTSPQPSYDYILRSDGRGEIDTLIGLPGQDGFSLAGELGVSHPTNTTFYLGNGANDYAIIRNFERGIDGIQIVGTLSDYTQVVSGGNLSIFKGGDLIAVVEEQTTPLGPAPVSVLYPVGGTVWIT